MYNISKKICRRPLSILDRTISLFGRYQVREDFRALNDFSIRVTNNSLFHPIYFQVTNIETWNSASQIIQPSTEMMFERPAGRYKMYLACESGSNDCDAEAILIGDIL